MTEFSVLMNELSLLLISPLYQSIQLISSAHLQVSIQLIYRFSQCCLNSISKLCENKLPTQNQCWCGLKKKEAKKKWFISHQSFVHPVQMIIKQTPTKLVCKLARLDVACEFIGRHQNHLEQKTLTWLRLQTKVISTLLLKT